LSLTSPSPPAGLNALRAPCNWRIAVHIPAKKLVPAGFCAFFADYSPKGSNVPTMVVEPVETTTGLFGIAPFDKPSYRRGLRVKCGR